MNKPNPFDWYWQPAMQSQQVVANTADKSHQSTTNTSTSSNHSTSNRSSSNSPSEAAASTAKATMDLAQSMAGGGLTGGLVTVITQIMVKPNVIKAKDMVVCQQVKQKHNSNHQQMESKVKQFKS